MRADDFLEKTRKRIKAAQNNHKPLNILDITDDFDKAVQLPKQISDSLADAFTYQDIVLKEGADVPHITAYKEGARIDYDGLIGFTGTLNLPNKQQLHAFFSVYEDHHGARKFTLGLSYPPNFKASDLLSELKPLDVFSLPEIQLVLSTFDYFSDKGADISRGTNLVCLVDLKGPLKLFGELKDQAKGLKSLVFDLEYPISLVGQIPPIPKSMSFGIRMPMRLGIDFTQIPGMPKEISGFLRKITTDDFLVSVNIGKSSGKVKKEAETTDSSSEASSSKSTKAAVNVTAQTGIRVTIGTQAEPLAIDGFGEVNIITGDFSVGGKFPSMIEAVYFALGDAGIEIFSDSGVEEILLLLGIPITGVGLRGKIALGTPSDNRASLEAVGKIAVQKDGGLGLIFDVTGKHLVLSDLAKLLERAMAKAKITQSIPDDAFPKVSLDKIRGKFAPFGGTVAGREVSKGYALAMEMTFLDKSFGIDVEGDFEKLKFSGRGWMPAVIVKSGNDLIFRLDSSGKYKRPKGTGEDGPYVSFSFDPKRPDRATFNTSALLDVPPLALKESVDFKYAYGRLNVDIDTSNIGFDVKFTVKLDPLKWREMGFEYSFKDGFAKFLQNQAKPVILAAKDKLVNQMADLDKKIGDLSGQISAGAQQTMSDADREIEKTRNRINELNRQIADIRAECDNAEWYDKVWKCPKAGGELVAPGAELAGLETYLETLLKPGKEVIKATSQAASSLTAEIGNANIAKTIAQAGMTVISGVVDAVQQGASIFVINEASGGVALTDLINGKLPLIKVLDISINIPGRPSASIKLKDIEFDFKHPDRSIATIVPQILKVIGIS